MIPGSTIAKEIGSKVEELSQNEQELSSQLNDLERKISVAVTDQADDLGQVAGTLLHSDNATPLKDYVHAARSKVEAMFRSQQQERNRLEQIKKDLEQKIRITSEEVSKAKEETRKLDQRFTETQTKSLEKAEADPEAIEAKTRSTQIAKELLVLKKRSQELDLLAKSKLPLLTSGPVYSYLQKVESKSGTTSGVDRWMADVFGYQDRKTKSALIQETAAEILSRVKRMEDSLKECEMKRKAILIRTENEMQLGAAENGLNLAQANAKCLQEQLARDEKELLRTTEQHQKLLQGKDDFEVQAKKELKEALKAANIVDIVAAARATPGNNALGDRINARDEQIRTDRRRATQLKTELSNIATQKQTVSRFENRFVSNGFNGSLSRFTSGFDVNSIIGLLILNKLSEHQAFNIFQQEHRYVEPPVIPGHHDQFDSRRNQPSSDSSFGFGSSGSDAGSWSTSGSDSGGSSSSSSDSGSWSTTDSV